MSLGDILGGIFQVICDFLNLLASIIPNPDPFPQLIEQTPDDVLLPFGFATYWLDAAIGLDYIDQVVTLWISMMIIGLTFAIVYWGIKVLKP